CRLATPAIMADRPAWAVTEFKAADRLFAKRRPGPAGRLYQLYSEITLADLAAQRGERELPLGRLSSIRPEALSVANYLVPFRLHRVLAAVHLRGGQSEEAERDLLSAIRIAEIGLRSVQSDRDRVTWAR